jgi:hypothetical protein
LFLPQSLNSADATFRSAFTLNVFGVPPQAATPTINVKLRISAAVLMDDTLPRTIEGPQRVES